MNNVPLGLTGFGFWLAVALIVMAIVWAIVKKQQMKHDLTLKLLEKGQSLDQELLAKLLASDKPAGEQKSIAEKRRDDSSVGGFLFLVAGLIIAFVGIMGGSELVPVGGQGPTANLMMFKDTGPSWLLIGLGVLSFAYGNWVIYSARKEYLQAKAEEKSSRD